MHSPATIVFMIGMLAVAALALGRQSIHSSTIQPVQKGGAFNIVSQLNFGQDRTLVWSTLLMRTGLQALSGSTIDATNAEGLFQTVGDSMPARVRDDAGRLIATHIDSGRELRLVFEPNSGAYVWSLRFVLAAAGNGSVMQYWLQFTDFTDNADDTAEQVRRTVVKGVGEFRQILEARIKPRVPAEVQP